MPAPPPALAVGVRAVVDDDARHGAMTRPGFTRPLRGWSMTRDEPVYAGAISAMAFPSFEAAEVVRADRRFTAALPWPMRTAGLNALDSHDTPRFAGSAAAAALPVGFGLSVGLPGIPFIWAGDELGLTAADGERSRTPMPWAALEDHAALIDACAALNRLRHEHVALRSGGLRRLFSAGDALAFVREHRDERVLVVATRADATASFALSGAGDAQRLLGDLVLDVADGRTAVRTGGTSIAFWRLAGVRAPA